MKEKYVVPAFKFNAFHCPHCEVYSHQKWFDMAYGKRTDYTKLYFENFCVSFCAQCHGYTLWLNDKMLYPVSSNAPLPAEDMPKDVKEDFIEARNIVNASPRSAAALLRLSLQKLMIHLGEKGKNINEDVANLVKKGLPQKIQKTLDIIRVFGNNAIHPGEIDLKDDTKTAIILFELLNMIIDIMINQPRMVDKIYKKIPDSTKEAIKKRDNKE